MHGSTFGMYGIAILSSAEFSRIGSPVGGASWTVWRIGLRSGSASIAGTATGSPRIGAGARGDGVVADDRERHRAARPGAAGYRRAAVCRQAAPKGQLNHCGAARPGSELRQWIFGRARLYRLQAVLVGTIVAHRYFKWVN